MSALVTGEATRLRWLGSVQNRSDFYLA